MIYILDGKSSQLASSYKTFSSDNKGIFRIGAIDCDEQAKICEKEKVSTFPTVRVYPPFPIPTNDIDVSGKFDSKSLRAKAG